MRGGLRIMSVLDLLKANNEYPIVFVGSGISKRYVHNFPSWPELLEFFWNQVNKNADFYAYLNTMRATIKDANPNALDSEVLYLTNIEAGSEIESAFNAAFYSGEVLVENLTQKEAYNQKMSPFKKAISNKFSSLTMVGGIDEELSLFKKFLNKTQILLTTNYDNLIEDCFNSINPNGIKKYIGQSGFFEETFGWAEIYKLHGSNEDPDSIIISKADYEKFSKNSILISAKIISLLIYSPIIFIGYSLTDMNIRKILKEFSSSLTPTEIKKMGSRIIIVEREEGEQDIRESQYYETELGCEYTVIKTDNFKKLYSELSEINQGISPTEVRRYQHIIKKLIVDSGKKGSLNALLIAPEQLDEIEKRIGDENLVVALGDSAYIFRMPDLVSYIHEYFLPETNIPTEIGLRLVANQGGRIPFMKMISGVDIEKTSLYPKEKEKLKQRVKNNKDVNSIISSIPPSNKVKYNSLNEILAMNYKNDKEFEIVGYNALNIDREELLKYIREIIIKLKEIGTGKVSSQFRRLILIYDLAFNK